MQLSSLGKHLFVIISVSIISACSSTPTEIQVPDEATLVSFQKVSADASASNVGANARWGGKIVEVKNLKDVSEIEIVFFPENSSGKPKVRDESAGRFKAVVKGFVDPMVFEQGRLITVLGQVGEKQSGLIGEQEYEYVTLNAAGYHMWKENNTVEVETIVFSPFFGYPFYRTHFTPWYDPRYVWSNRATVRYRTHHNRNQGSRSSNRSSGSSSKPSVRSEHDAGSRPSHLTEQP